MEGIEHRMVVVNGIKMHVAEKGEGPVVLFLHGFPELWYTWRHQMIAMASHGYHAVAPDLRGFSDSEAPASYTSYTCFHVVGDLIALIDHLGADKVYLVGHDWGAQIGWYFCLFRPDRVKAYVSLTVPFRPRNPKIKPIEGMRVFFGDDYYMCRFQVSLLLLHTLVDSASGVSFLFIYFFILSLESTTEQSWYEKRFLHIAILHMQVINSYLNLYIYIYI